MMAHQVTRQSCMKQGVNPPNLLVLSNKHELYYQCPKKVSTCKPVFYREPISLLGGISP